MYLTGETMIAAAEFGDLPVAMEKKKLCWHVEKNSSLHVFMSFTLVVTDVLTFPSLFICLGSPIGVRRPLLPGQRVLMEGRSTESSAGTCG